MTTDSFVPGFVRLEVIGGGELLVQPSMIGAACSDYDGVHGHCAKIRLVGDHEWIRVTHKLTEVVQWTLEVRRFHEQWDGAG